MNKGVVFWIVAVLLFVVGTIPINFEVYTKVSQKLPYEKVVQSIEIYFENVTSSKLVSKATPYNAEGYREYGNTSYALYREVNVSVPYFRYGYGKPKNPEIVDVNNGKWTFTFLEDNCTTSFRLFNPNYVPIYVLVNYTVLQENKKFWVGTRGVPSFENVTIEARQYSLPIIHNTRREHGYDEKDYEEYFGRGFCSIDTESFKFDFQNSTFIISKQETDYEKLEQQGEKYYEFNYIGVKYVVEKENVTVQEKIPHTYLANKTVIEYRTVDRIIKKQQRLPIYFALFAIYDSYKYKKYGLNTTSEDIIS